MCKQVVRTMQEDKRYMDLNALMTYNAFHKVDQYGISISIYHPE